MHCSVDHSESSYCLIVFSAGTVGIYQFLANPCFKTTTNVWALGFEVVFPAANLTQDDSLVFTAFMTKDSRVARSSTTVRVWAMKMDASALDSIDDLLAKGDTNAALLVINLVTDGLNGDESQVPLPGLKKPRFLENVIRFLGFF